MLVSVLSEGLGLLILLPFIEFASGQVQSVLTSNYLAVLEALGLQAQNAKLLGTLGVFFALVVVQGLLVWRRDVALLTLSTSFVDHWRNELFKGLSRAPWIEVTKIRRSDIEHSITNNVNRLDQGTSSILTSSVSALILIVQLTVSMLIAPKLTLLFVAAIFLTSLLAIPLLRSARTLGERLTESGSGIHSLLEHFLSGLKLAKIHSLEPKYVSRFEGQLADVRHKLIGFVQQKTMVRFVFKSVMAMIACVAIAVGVLVLETPLSELAVVLLIMARISGPAIAVVHGTQSLANMLPAFESLLKMRDQLNRGATRSTSSLPAQTHRTLGAAAVVLNNVGFTYPGNSKSIFSGVSAEVSSGGFTVVRGSSGSGKTSLIDLIAGLLEPTRGTIHVDDRLLDANMRETWKNEIAYVPQDPYLFNVSIVDNLSWANSECTEDEIWNALELACAKDFVLTLPKGIETIVGERGLRLSGGERQRICLARALLRNPRLLILDEATNSMDIELEEDFVSTLKALSGKVTILMITHRLTGLGAADCILELKAGQLKIVQPVGQNGRTNTKKQTQSEGQL